MASVRLTLHDAIELFPEIKPELPRLLAEKRTELKDIKEKAARLEDLKLKTMRVHWKNKEYQKAITLEALVDKSPIFQEAHDLQLQLYGYETALGKRDSVAQEEIRRAKEYPMANLLPRASKRGGRYHTCPFHNEKTPSFYVHKDNGFSCFGCNKHGDTISFVMEYYKLDFRSAVRAINSYGLL